MTNSELTREVAPHEPLVAGSNPTAATFSLLTI